MGSEPHRHPRAPEPAGWQAQKSAATRHRIVEATIRCFVDLGYAGTTTTAIAARAGLSRGAMLHHFPSKAEVVRAAVEHLHGRRLKAFRKSLQRVVPADGDRVRQALEAYWAHVRHPMFVAFLELAVAARTDRELAAILVPAQQAFESEWRHTAREVFPEWLGNEERFELALDLSRYVLEGLAAELGTGRAPARERRLLGHLERTLRELVGG
ncbi:MAG TPA: TetR/AcrR family transcriptional regulator [Steroidobacteraceae bacterium]|nr:TetR/AcrR family transcriptional regulator [Steroidobacteraceae bacterium]